MKEYESILTEYAKDGYDLYSKTVSRARWGDKAVAESYLEKYWIPNAEYEDKWRIIQQRVFTAATIGVSEMVFQPDFEIFVLRGGCLFTQDDFERLLSCTNTLSEKCFVVIENSFGGKLPEVAFRMKFPTDIRWEEMTSGNFISAIMLEMPHKDYFVFSESATWGKYVANDHQV